MKYDDLDKTVDLFDIVDEVPTAINNIEMEGASKIDLTSENPEIPKNKQEISKPSSKKPKKSLKEKWQNIPKKKKIIIIVSGVIILILIIALILFFILKKDEEQPKKTTNEPIAPSVIVEKDNYIYKDGELTFLDTNDNALGTYECKNKDEKKCYVAYFSDEDNFDVANNYYENGTLVERRTPIYENKYAFVYDSSEVKDGNIILYNIYENKEEGNYSLVKGFASSNYVIVKNVDTNKYGAIEITPSEVKSKIEFNFEYLGFMDKDAKIVAKNNNRYSIYNKDGKVESKSFNNEIKSYNNKYVVTESEGDYSVYNYNGKNIIEGTYDYIKLLNDYVILVNNRKLYIRDYENNWYNGDGIALETTDYVPKNVYDKDKVLKEEDCKRSFDITVNNKEITITIYSKNSKEKTTVVNTIEGENNKDLAFMNYFNGKLYFYNDEDKKELIGTYTCSNKNEIKDDKLELENCRPATESFFSKNALEPDNSENLGWLPIFNERYVFVQDSMDANNKTIMLYDLKNSKTLSKYNEVDAGTYSKETKLTFKEADNLPIIAKNKNNKFGVIKISKDVTGFIGFNYNKIEKIKNYYMAHESTNTYVLIDSNGKLATEHFGYKIADFKNNYVKLQNESDNKFGVMSFSGENITELSYLDITLYDDYLVGITIDKKLDIIEYANPEISLKEPINIGDNYENNYEVIKTSTGYTVKIKNPNQSINITESDFNEKLPDVITP